MRSPASWGRFGHWNRRFHNAQDPWTDLVDCNNLARTSPAEAARSLINLNGPWSTLSSEGLAATDWCDHPRTVPVESYLSECSGVWARPTPVVPATSRPRYPRRRPLCTAVDWEAEVGKRQHVGALAQRSLSSRRTSWQHDRDLVVWDPTDAVTAGLAPNPTYLEELLTGISDRRNCSETWIRSAMASSDRY